MVRPIYRSTMSVLEVTYFLAHRAHLGAQHMPIALGRFAKAWACPRVRLGELELIHGGTMR
jgi:hypothetical protein